MTNSLWGLEIISTIDLSKDLKFQDENKKLWFKTNIEGDLVLFNQNKKNTLIKNDSQNYFKVISSNQLSSFVIQKSWEHKENILYFYDLKKDLLSEIGYGGESNLTKDFFSFFNAEKNIIVWGKTDNLKKKNILILNPKLKNYHGIFNNENLVISEVSNKKESIIKVINLNIGKSIFEETNKTEIKNFCIYKNKLFYLKNRFKSFHIIELNLLTKKEKVIYKSSKPFKNSFLCLKNNLAFVEEKENHTIKNLILNKINLTTNKVFKLKIPMYFGKLFYQNDLIFLQTENELMTIK